MVSASRSDFKSVKAIYFDLDDTLCGYWDASKKGLREAFEATRPEGKTVEDMVLMWGEAFRSLSSGLKDTPLYQDYLTSGEPTRTEQMRRTLGLAGIEDEEMAKQLSETYMVQRDRNLTLFHDALQVLDALKPLYPLGLITNGPADIQRQEIATVGVEKYFEHIFIEGEMRIGKPYREVFERAENAVGFKGAEVCMVGNSYGHDILGAMDSGWKTVWIRRPSDVPPSSRFGGEPEPIPTDKPLPTAIISELSELLPLLLD